MRPPLHWSALPLVCLLGIAAGLDIMAVGFEPVLTGTGRAGIVLRIRGWAAALLFVAMVPLIGWWGTLGAGWAVLLSSAVGLALLVRASRRADAA